MPVRFSQFPLLGVICLLLIFGGNRQSVAQIESVSLGIRGNVKLGYWVPARIKYRGKLPGQVVSEISLPDTDGISAKFVDRAPLVREIGEFTFVETLVKLGRAKGTASFKLSTASGDEITQAIADDDYSIRSICTPQDPLVEFYVSLGRPLELKGAAVIGGRNEYAPAITSTLTADELLKEGVFGSHWKALESIDAMILEAGSFVESPMPYAMQTALAAWVKNGGRLAISGGPQLQSFFQGHPEIASLFQGEVKGVRRLSSTSAIERSVKGATEAVSDQRDRPFTAIIGDFNGEVMVQEGESPVIVRQSIGFGKLIVVTINLADEPLASWSDRKSLVGYLIAQLNHQPNVRRDLDQRETRFGYEDFSGQLRSALDAFEGVSSVNFTVVAGIAILFICLIGPVDYFLLKRFSSRMEMTWVTFSLMVALTGYLTYWIFSSTKSDQLLCRQVEVVDIDPSEQLARGSLWTHIYSPVSQKYDICWNSTAISARPEQFASWFGFPGNALGGMDNRSINSNESARYEINLKPNGLAGVPINVASTKGLHLDWRGDAMIGEVGQPKVVRRTLTGRITNPLEIELENVFVVHDRSIYQYQGKLGPKESFDLGSDTRDRSFSDYLNRRKIKDLGTEATAWRISDTNLRRILEVMMFFERSGGRGYVNLYQRYLNHIDFSHTAGQDGAILVGRSPKPLNRLVIDGKELNTEYEESWTYYRILIPVSKEKN